MQSDGKKEKNQNYRFNGDYFVRNEIILFSFDNRYSTVTLFPQFGTVPGGTSQTFTIRCGLVNADDPLYIDNTHWACTISEYMN